MITVDPGVNGCGKAYWVNGKLAAVRYDSEAITAFINHHVVIELPQVYVGSKSKGNPNDLIRVAFEAGRVAGNSRTYETVPPRQWKGTIKKEAMIRRILSKLTDEELKLISNLGLPPSKEHNVIDAVGIGLWKLGRL